MTFKSILIPLIAILAFSTFVFLPSNEALSTTAPICTNGTTRYKTTQYCKDGVNIYGLFTQSLVNKCISLSKSIACTNKQTLKINFNDKEYEVNQLRWAIKFYESFGSVSGCPLGSKLVGGDCVEVVAGVKYIVGGQSKATIQKCLAEYTANDCLNNRLELTKYNLINGGKPEQPIDPTPVDPNKFDTTPLKKPIVRTSELNNENSWERFIGFDYGNKFEVVYNNDNWNYVDGQGIVVSARKGQTYNPNYNPGSNDSRLNKQFGNFASTKLMSNERFQYGHMQFKAKIPNFSGILPAIWLVNDDNKSLFSEIDIAEVPGSEKNNSYVVTHYGPTPTSLTTDYAYKNLPKISTDYQTYDVYRLPGRLVVLYNGVKVFDKNTWQSTVRGVNALEVPMRFIINLNVGDKWAGNIDSSKFPSQLMVKDIIMEHY